MEIPKNHTSEMLMLEMPTIKMPMLTKRYLQFINIRLFKMPVSDILKSLKCHIQNANNKMIILKSF